MPELPDVETFRRYVDATALRRRIVDVEVLSRRVLAGVSSRRLRQVLRGATFNRTRRHGKHLFVDTNGSQWLVLHFGMTGYLDYGKERTRGPHDRVIFVFAKKCSLAYVCPRLFGRVTLTASVEEFVEMKKLGPDAMSVSAEGFACCLCGSKATVKSSLMNQRLIAGVGNLYSDEILFQSQVHPLFRSDRLSVAQATQIHRDMRKVLRRATERKADPMQLPGSYLLPHRRIGGSCPRCSGKLARRTVAGRTAYWCPACQKT